MQVTIHSTFLPHADPEASLMFCRDTSGFEVCNDTSYNGLRWITVGQVGQVGQVGHPDPSIVLSPAGCAPGVTEAKHRMIAEMMAKGTDATLLLAMPDRDGNKIGIQNLRRSDRVRALGKSVANSALATCL